MGNNCHSNSFGIFSKSERFLTAFTLPEQSLCPSPTPVVLGPWLGKLCSHGVESTSGRRKLCRFQNFNQSLIFDHSIILVTELDLPMTTIFLFFFVLDLVILFGFQCFCVGFQDKSMSKFVIHVGFWELSWRAPLFGRSFEIEACRNVSFLHTCSWFYSNIWILVMF